jgi:hypothetical protein
MDTTKEKTAKKPEAKKKIDARSGIKPRGLRGMFKDIIIVNGPDEEVFGLTLTTNVG